MREELFHLQEPGSYVGEVVKAMGKTKVLVKVGPEGKYVVDLDKDIDINKCLVREFALSRLVFVPLQSIDLNLDFLCSAEHPSCSEE